MTTKQKQLLDFLQTEHKRYNETILPLYPKSLDDFIDFDHAKSEFLENLWDTISEHFETEERVR